VSFAAFLISDPTFDGFLYVLGKGFHIIFCVDVGTILYEMPR